MLSRNVFWLVMLGFLVVPTSFGRHQAVTPKSHEPAVVIADGDPPPIDCGLYDICRNSKIS